jgi:hypothetical protein
MIQKKIMITQEAFVSVFVSIHESTVVAWTNIVNMIIETDKEAIIIYGLDLSSPAPALAPNITGKSGSTHGARIVSIQAKNEISKSVIIIF